MYYVDIYSYDSGLKLTSGITLGNANTKTQHLETPDHTFDRYVFESHYEANCFFIEIFG